MKKLIWILITGIVIIAGVYFVFTKNNTSNQPTSTSSTEQQNINSNVSSQQNTQVKTPPQTTQKPVQPTGGALQPPSLPE